MSVPATMRALVQSEYGDLSTFALSSIPIPKPSTGQVLIRVHAASLNPVDLKRGMLDIRGDVFPITVGYDVAGVVHASDSPAWNVGDRVFGDVMAQSAGVKTRGSIAEFCVCEGELLARMPRGSGFEECAAVPVAACTAVQALQQAGMKRGDKVFVSGGAGGVGVHAMQVAKGMFGAAEVATTASEGKRAFVEKYGADRVVNYREEKVGEVLKGWADVGMDCAGDLEMQKGVVREGGKLVTIVSFDTPGVDLVMLAPTKEMMEKVAEAMEKGKLTAVIDRVYAMDEWRKALEHLKGGRAMGKIIIKVRDE